VDWAVKSRNQTLNCNLAPQIASNKTVNLNIRLIDVNPGDYCPLIKKGRTDRFSNP
jgi:hypothetical protein